MSWTFLANKWRSMARKQKVLCLVIGGVYIEKQRGEEITLSNFSNTHQVHTNKFYSPRELSEVEELVKESHTNHTKLRPVGSGLSPNGIGFSEEGMVSLSHMSSLLSVDPETKQVTVQAGMRVSDLVQALKPYGLTLQNFASIAEQQVGGITQVSAHGTGATIPPIDEQVVAMKIVTPAKGVLSASRASHPLLFPILQVGLGALGVVAELTLQCVNDHVLVERTVTMTHEEIKQHHQQLLKENLHVKYMWIPYTDTVVVVTCNPPDKGFTPGFSGVDQSEDEKLKEARALLKSLSTEPENYVNQLTFTQLRDELLYIDPLDVDHVIAVNKAEAYYWQKSMGERRNLSDKILGFDCGGEQRVMEVAFPVGSLNNLSNADLTYMFDLLKIIEEERIPAPSPLEQRWTSSSRGVLSPAYSEDPAELFSWLGIIMYLPPEESHSDTRKAVNQSFDRFTHLCQEKLWRKYKCRIHWAKIEIPNEEAPDREQMKRDLRGSYDWKKVLEVKQELDPHSIMNNRILDFLFSE